MKYFKSFVVVCLCCLFLIPERVYADSPTYTNVSGTFQLGNFKYGSNYFYTAYSSSEVRLVAASNLTNTVMTILYSKSSFSYGSDVSRSAYPTTVSTTSNAQSFNDDGETIYYAFVFNSQDRTGIVFADGINVVNDTYSNTRNETTARYYNRYAYGDSTIDPTPPPPDYGDLLDVKFSTSIAGGGSAAVNNIDHITWNPEMDSNGIAFDGTERVQIKAIAGKYTDSSRNDLLGLGVTHFDYNSGSEHMLAEYPATRGYYDVSWSHVIQQLNAGSISDFLNIRKNDDVWLKSGWIYQIRLVAGDYESQWITIYNGTSSGVENSLTIENSTELNMKLINTIQQINNMNNSVTNWEIDNTTINMENQDGTETTDKPWWAYLLEALVSLLNGILVFLGNLIGDLIDAIVSLFQPEEFTINNFNEYKLELKQNSGIFGQAIDFTNTLKNTLLGVQYHDPVLHWSGISFGETVFIPAADYNLNDYVTMWGLGDFRTMAYLCSDGFIYFSLLVLIVRKLNEVLKK